MTAQSNTPPYTLADICGVRMADSNAFCRLCYFTRSDLRQRMNAGLPYIKIGGRYWFPVDLCERWLLGSDVRAAANTLKKQVYRAVEELPKQKWYRKVENFNDKRPWNA